MQATGEMQECGQSEVWSEGILLCGKSDLKLQNAKVQEFK